VLSKLVINLLEGVHDGPLKEMRVKAVDFKRISRTVFLSREAGGFGSSRGIQEHKRRWRLGRQ